MEGVNNIMANLTINFDKNINTSLQKGDTVLFLKNGSLIELGIELKLYKKPTDLSKNLSLRSSNL